MLIVVALRDSAARVFAQPFFVQHSAQAVRGLRDEVNRAEKSSDVARHPGDFELHELGTFDDETGRLHSHETTKLIVRAVDLKDSA